MKKFLAVILALTMVASLAACGNKASATTSAASAAASSSSSAASGSVSAASGSEAAASGAAASSTAEQADGISGPLDPSIQFNSTVKVQIYGTDGQKNYISDADAKYISGFTQTLYFMDDAVVAAINTVTVTDEAAQDADAMASLQNTLSSEANGGTITVSGSQVFVTYTDLSGFSDMTKANAATTLTDAGYQVIE